ncbi:hypothetical protein ABID47_005507 [Paenibacillus favisporus]|uniref:DUF1349 domain-containing protein n=1 Tax=Paenibacillus favisporus TaxID=221028 RepID=A0ABV2FAS7_9BACL
MTIKPSIHREAEGFTKLLLAEWAKFHSVRGWIIGIAVTALLTILPGLFLAASSNEGPPTLLGPDGKAVTDKFYFVHKTLTGDGSITARVTSLTGKITYPPPDNDLIVPGVVPWAKAGIMIKDSTKQGSPYAAIMVTGSHGVRMQSNFFEDIPGHPGSVPRWLRLTRSDQTIIGYESVDGQQWTKIGAADLADSPASVQVGLFVTSPGDVSVSEAKIRFANATAVFDHLKLQGDAFDEKWSHDDIGIGTGEPAHHYGGVKESGDTITVTGSGDIAPLGVEGSWTIERPLIGMLTGLVAVIVVSVLYVTADYRRKLVRNPQIALHRLERLLAAKGMTIGMAAFVAGIVAATITIPLSKQILLSKGNHILPVPLLTELRVMLGTAAVLALGAILAAAFAAIFRRRFVAITASLTVLVLPYILANVIPINAAQWLLRLTPAAGFAVQQSIPEYPQVISLYTPQLGYYPLLPWAGFAVLCFYCALALGIAFYMLQREQMRSHIP